MVLTCKNCTWSSVSENKQDFLSSYHNNVAAYKRYISNPQGAKTKESHNDDGDYDIGKTAKDALGKKNAKNIAVFITRFYGGKHLGPKRFQEMNNLVEDVLAKYEQK